MSSSFFPLPPPKEPPIPSDAELYNAYEDIVEGGELNWRTQFSNLKLLGSGGQGFVFLGQRQGADGFTLPVALKVFSPESYRDGRAYDEEMARIADVAARVALIQHDNLLYIYDFVAQNRVRIMGMEWIEGYDLRQLMSPEILVRSRERLEEENWNYLNDVVLTAGVKQSRFKPGVAVQILRDCLAALDALHREGVAHGDLKPANVMIKKTGTAKLIDIGSAMDMQAAAARRVWSPAYAAPEVIAGEPASPLSDLASLGYILVEMLAGQPIFAGLNTFDELAQAKASLEHRLTELLPREVLNNDLLIYLCQRLVSADPGRRFSTALSASMGRRGATAFHRQLVKSDMASEYGNDLRVWLEQIH